MSFDLKKIGTVVNTIKKCIDVAAEAYNTIEKSSESTDISESAEDLQDPNDDAPISDYHPYTNPYGGNGTYYSPTGYNDYSKYYNYQQQQQPYSTNYDCGYGMIPPPVQGYSSQTNYQPTQTEYQWTYF